jgi:hypothetical protein
MSLFSSAVIGMIRRHLRQFFTTKKNENKLLKDFLKIRTFLPLVFATTKKEYLFRKNFL